MNRRVIASAAFALSMLVGVTSSARASVLLPGGSVDPLLGTTLGGDPSLGGVVIDSVLAPFSGLDVNNVVRFTGVLESHVVRELSGTLSFYYQLSNDALSQDGISRFANTSFTGWATDVNYRLDAMVGIAGGSILPGTQQGSEATRSVDGSVVGFNFIAAPVGAGVLAQGTTSLWHVIRTDATTYIPGNTAIINGGNVNVQTFAPAPEPATLGLVGLGALALLRRRR